MLDDQESLRLPSQKKEPKLLEPQQAINQTWREFLARKVQPALCILPFERNKPLPRKLRPNELLLEDYTRVAEECRRRVNKIIGECKRMNMRFRDPDWDLDWDIKYEKGYCLNSLNMELFSISKITTSDTEATVPKAVKRVHEVFKTPTFMKNVRAGDVKQGNLGNCWLMASFTAMAGVEGGIQQSCAAYDTEIGIYGFVFYRDGQWIHSIIDDKLFLKSPCWDSPSKQRELLEEITEQGVEGIYKKTYQTGSKALFFGQCKDQDDTWVPLMEKAYAKAHGDYASLEGGWVGEGIEDLSGGVTTELLSSDILNLDTFWENEMSRVNRDFLFGCSTGHLENGYGERDGIRETHAYVVMDARTLKSGQRLVKLRNPWGEHRDGLWEGPWSDGSKEWTVETQAELGHTFGNDSVFWISYEDLVRKYTVFDRTRIFQAPDWRCSQEWIMASVPWYAKYVTTFQISLYQESPVVMSLSQLDGRYFEGLHGQYVFRLHFRLHNHKYPGTEDYIVQSHSNYYTRRSVSVDIPKLLAGCYTVDVKVAAERDRDLPSVEDVVRDECKSREDNEKLARVGQAYDLAHSKVWGYMSEAASRQRCEGSGAEPCIQAGIEKKSLSQSRKVENRDDGEAQSNTDMSALCGRRVLDTIDEVIEPECDGLIGDDDSPIRRAPIEATRTQNEAAELCESECRTQNEAAELCESECDNKQIRTRDLANLTNRGSDMADLMTGGWEDPCSAPTLASQPVGSGDGENKKITSPWNAACALGFRVFSKDPALELRVIPSGGNLK